LTLQTVLQSHLCLDKSRIYKIIEPLFGAGLLTASGKIYLNIKQKYIKYLFSCVEPTFSKFSRVKSQNV